jgi:hypothetical protein
MSYDKLKATREYKQFRRTVDPQFVEAKRASRKRYSRLCILERAFANAYPQQFQEFIKDKTSQVSKRAKGLVSGSSSTRVCQQL